MNRNNLKMVAMGCALVSTASCGATVYRKIFPQPGKTNYLVLTEVDKPNPPEIFDGKIKADDPDLSDFVDERFRSRENCSNASACFYVGKIAYDCQVQEFNFMGFSEGVQQVWIPIEKTDFDKLGCVIEQSSGERIPLSIFTEQKQFRMTHPGARF